MDPVRIDVTTPSRAYTVAIERQRHRSPRSDSRRSPRARTALRRVEPAGVAAARAARRARPQGRRADPRPRWRTSQAAVHGRPDLRCARPRERGSRVHARHLRRRRHRRHGRFRGGHLPEGHRAHSCADDAARAGGQRHRRQGRRQSSARQEHDRLVLSAARGRHRPDGARHAAAPRVPGGALRGHQVRRHVERRALRSRDARSNGHLRARTGGAHAGHRRIVPHQGGGRLG